jgi:glycosyltransferase involved in cell wall biosynthesis
MNPEISVILPIYNAEKYLEKCVNSICNQTLKEIEIICINSCSTDSSLQILQNLNKKDSRIKIIDLKKDNGVSNARNLGIESAQGKYIYFIDSDDWIDYNYLETMFQKIEEVKSNILINANFVNEYENGNKKAYSKFKFITKDFEVIDSKTVQRLFAPVIWTRLYKKDYLEKYKIKFPLLQIGGEDIFFSYACDLMQQNSYILKGPYYHYFQRDSSAMRIKERGFRYIQGFKLLYDFLNDHKINLDNIKLFFVESLIIDTKEKFNFIKQYFIEIKQIFNKNREIYNKQELFLFNIIEESKDFETFISKYNPNISLSFLRKEILPTKR